MGRGPPSVWARRVHAASPVHLAGVGTAPKLVLHLRSSNTADYLKRYILVCFQFVTQYTILHVRYSCGFTPLLGTGTEREPIRLQLSCHTRAKLEKYRQLLRWGTHRVTPRRLEHIERRAFLSGMTTDALKSLCVVDS